MTVISSPGLRRSLVQPDRVNSPMLWSSPPQGTVCPSSVAFQNSWLCGLAHTYFVTLPVTVTGLSLSYEILVPWCANAAPARSRAALARKQTILIFMPTLRTRTYHRYQNFALRNPSI